MSEYTKDQWIIGFFDIERPRFLFSPFLKPGFRHALGLKYDPDKKIWMLMDWSKRGLKVTVHDSDEVDRIIAFVERHNGRFILCNQEKAIYRFPIMPCWCVTAIRHLLGIRKPLFTPYQLYKELKRRGATPIFENVRTP